MGGRKCLYFLAGSQNLDTSLGDDHGLLKLRRALSILSDSSPAIGPHLILPGSLVNHGLDCEDMSNLHNTNGLVAGIMRNVGSAVEKSMDAVAAVCLDDLESFCLGVLLNNVAQISVQSTRLD